MPRMMENRRKQSEMLSVWVRPLTLANMLQREKTDAHLFTPRILNLITSPSLARRDCTAQPPTTAVTGAVACAINLPELTKSPACSYFRAKYTPSRPIAVGGSDNGIRARKRWICVWES